jgi:hypothetical protein
MSFKDAGSSAGASQRAEDRHIDEAISSVPAKSGSLLDVFFIKAKKITFFLYVLFFIDSASYFFNDPEIISPLLFRKPAKNVLDHFFVLVADILHDLSAFSRERYGHDAPVVLSDKALDHSNLVQPVDHAGRGRQADVQQARKVLHLVLAFGLDMNESGELGDRDLAEAGKVKAGLHDAVPYAHDIFHKFLGERGNVSIAHI